MGIYVKARRVSLLEIQSGRISGYARLSKTPTISTLRLGTEIVRGKAHGKISKDKQDRDYWYASPRRCEVNLFEVLDRYEFGSSA